MLRERSLILRLLPFSSKTSRVACGRDSKGQECSNNPGTNMAGGHGEELDEALVGYGWGSLNKAALQQSRMS